MANDGKGVKVHHNVTDFDNAFDAPSVLEVKADIKIELSVIVARNASGYASLMKMVRVLLASNLPLKRPMYFILYAAEDT